MQYHQNLNGIVCINIEADLKLEMETQRTPDSQTTLKKKNDRTQISQFQNLTQKYSHQQCGTGIRTYRLVE